MDVTIYGKILNAPTTLVLFGIPAKNRVIHHVKFLVVLEMFKKADILVIGLNIWFHKIWSNAGP